MGTNEHGDGVTCLDCVNWKSRWNTVPRQDGCQAWRDVTDWAASAGRLAEMPSGTAPAQGGLVCPRFVLHVPSPKDDLDAEQTAELIQMQKRVRDLYVSLCRLERGVSRMTRYQGVDDEDLCAEVRKPAKQLLGEFRPLKTQVSTLDSVLADGSKWLEFAGAHQALDMHGVSGGRQALGALEDAGAHGASGTYGAVAPQAHKASVSQAPGRSSAGEAFCVGASVPETGGAVQGDPSREEYVQEGPSCAACLEAFRSACANLEAQLSSLKGRVSAVEEIAAALPGKMAERQEQEHQRRLDVLQEDYDLEFKDALIRYRGLNQRLLHLRFFERAKRDELLKQKKLQLRRLEKINAKFADTGVALNDLESLDVVTGA
ncbi:MAG: hypothetical protein Q4F23_02980 [Coriobacteriia bacterium]|nr:hypothetical protein [Coriobacteriia bacterium]